MNPPAYPWPLNILDRWCGYVPSSYIAAYPGEIAGCIVAVIGLLVVYLVVRIAGTARIVRCLVVLLPIAFIALWVWELLASIFCDSCSVFYCGRW